MTEDKGNPEGKKEPAAAIGEEGRSAADRSRATTDQGGTGGTREPGEAARQRVSGGAEGGRSQGRAIRSTGRDGAKLSEAGGIRCWVGLGGNLFFHTDVHQPVLGSHSHSLLESRAHTPGQTC